MRGYRRLVNKLANWTAKFGELHFLFMLRPTGPMAAKQTAKATAHLKQEATPT